MCIIYIILVLIPIVVELGAPKPIVIYDCFSMVYEIINLTIQHKNDTQIGFRPDLHEMRLLDLPTLSNCRNINLGLLLLSSRPVSLPPGSMRISRFADEWSSQ